MPSHSDDAERGFSALKKVKTDWRGSLKDRSLNDEMTILLNSHDESSLNSMTAIYHWNNSSARSRRPDSARPRHQAGLQGVLDRAHSDSDSDSDLNHSRIRCIFRYGKC